MSEHGFKAGDRVLVEAEVLRITDHAQRPVLVEFQQTKTAGWYKPEHIRPLTPPGSAFTEIPIDIAEGEGKHPPIKPSEMQVGDKVLRRGCPNAKPRIVVGTHGCAWIQSNNDDGSPIGGAAWPYRDTDEGDGWLLIERDGADQRQPPKTRRKTWGELPERFFAIIGENLLCVGTCDGRLVRVQTLTGSCRSYTTDCPIPDNWRFFALAE